MKPLGPCSLSLPPRRRVRKSDAFRRARTLGRRASTRHFVFLLTPQLASERGESRLGLVVSRKVGNAVVRNRVKRLCRECFRRTPGFLPNGVDLIVIAKGNGSPMGGDTGPGGELNYQRVRQEWDSVARKLRALGEMVLRDAVAAHSSDAAPGSTEDGRPKRARTR